MQKLTRHKIVIIGCGNVAWHLARHFAGLKKYDIFIYNHKANKLLNDFKVKLKCTTQVGLDKIIQDAEFYFICVADRSISSVSKKIKTKKGIVMHTSGSIKISELGKENNTAVFYPLQTFSKGDDVDWKEIPIVLESTKTVTLHKVTDLAAQFSRTFIYAKEHERLTLHLSAVIVNNFTNALYVVADDLLKETWQASSIKLLLPLIKQTVLKLERLNALAAQTGPAKRGDKKVMQKHLKLLSKNKDLKKIYLQLSNLIVKQQTKKHA